jgi:N6-L-threonylcarbamoyladenine synthase
MNMKDIDYIAVTNRPGLPLSLEVGVNFAKRLAIRYNKPLIPIHHMEAHALIGMLSDPTIKFPFVTVLLSGGHAQIALVTDVDHFYLLGQSIDSAPGELFDKVSRRLKLRNLGEFYSCVA